MRLRRRLPQILVITTVLLSFIYPLTSFAGTVTTLADIIAKSQEAADKIANAKRSREAAFTQKQIIGSSLLPTLKLSSKYGFQKPWHEQGSSLPREESSPWSSQFGLTLIQTLNKSGTGFILLSQARVADRLAEVQEIEDKNAYAQSVGEKYFEHLGAIAEAKSGEQTLDLVSKQYSSVAKMYKQGLKSRKDFLRLKIDFHRAQMTFKLAEEAVAQTQSLLVSEAGFSKPDWQFELATLADSEDSLALNFAEIDIQDVPQVRAAAFNVELEDYNVNMARMDWWPQIGIEAFAGYETIDYYHTPAGFGDNHRTYYGTALTFEWDIIDFGVKSREKHLASLKFETAAAKAAILATTTQQQLQQLIRDVLAVKQEVSAVEELVRLEEESTNYLVGEYRSGRVSYLEMIVGLEGLSSARLKLIQNRKKLKIFELNFHYLKGDLFTWLLSKV